MRVRDLIERRIRQRVAIHQEELFGADDVERLPGATGAAEQRGLLPRIADPRAEVGAVTKHRRERVRQMVQVAGDRGHARVDEPLHDAARQWFAGQRHRRLCPNTGEGIKAGAEACGQQQCGKWHRPLSA